MRLSNIGLLVLFLLFYSSIFSQEADTIYRNLSLDGFLDAKWGASRSEIKKIMKEKAQFISETPEKDLVFSGGLLGLNPVFSWGFLFYSQKFAAVIITFDNVTWDNCGNLVNKIKDSLIEKYGSISTWDTDFSDGTIYNTWWFFDLNMKDILSGITLTVRQLPNNSPELTLTYYNQDLFQKKINASKSEY